jgi:hypothetical protein
VVMGTVKEVVQLYNLPHSVETSPPAFPQSGETQTAETKHLRPGAFIRE